MIVLYDLEGRAGGRFSPFCWRAKFALAHKGLAWTEEPVGFTEKDKIAFSGQKLVPVLVDGGTVVTDSWAIAQHLDAAHPGPALFRDEQARAAARFVAHWTDSALHLAMFPLVVADIHANARPEDQAYVRESREKRLGARLEDVQRAARETKVEALRATLEPVRRQLREHPFLAGEGPGYADYCVMGALMWARGVTSFPLLAADDPVAAWRERMLDLFGGLGRRAKAAA